MVNNTFSYKYSVDGELFDNSYKMSSTWDENNPDYLAEEAAEDYENNHDGWEDTWPIDFEIWTIDGESLGKFTVEKEYSPTFSASEKEDDSRS